MVHDTKMQASSAACAPHIFTTNRCVTNGDPIFPRGGNAAEQEGIDSRCIVTAYLIDDLRRNPGPLARG